MVRGFSLSGQGFPDLGYKTTHIIQETDITGLALAKIELGGKGNVALGRVPGRLYPRWGDDVSVRVTSRRGEQQLSDDYRMVNRGQVDMVVLDKVTNHALLVGWWAYGTFDDLEMELYGSFDADFFRTYVKPVVVPGSRLKEITDVFGSDMLLFAGNLSRYEGHHVFTGVSRDGPEITRDVLARFVEKHLKIEDEGW
jgi:hypothetical protein